MTTCTIIARNYVARARVLKQSFAEHHPGERFATLIIDGLPADRRTTGVGEVFLLSDLHLPERELFDMAAVYDVVEFATALKPALLMRLLADGGPVVYLDPDIVVYGPMTQAFSCAAHSGIALTPHVLQPIPRDGHETSERTIMHAGLFNLGFIGVGDAGWPFLRWWHERLQRDAVVDLGNALFTDQRWVDWVPALFPHAVIRDCGYNVAYWNLHERPLRQDPSGAVSAGGRPLVFFHFSGWDPDQPWVLSRHTGNGGRIVLADDAVLSGMCRRYGADLAAAGQAGAKVAEYGHNDAGRGEQLVHELRRYLRNELARSEATGSARPPNPYLDPDQFSVWISESLTGPNLPDINRFGLAVRFARPDLQAAFAEPLTKDAPGFAHWLACDPWAVALAQRVLPRSASRPTPSSGSRPPCAGGWNLLAYANAELGVGEAGRRLAHAVLRVGVPARVVAVSAERSRQQHLPEHRLATDLAYPNTITCANADQMERIWTHAGVGGRARGRQIGLWFWEVDRVPDSWKATMELLDEVWVTSDFTKKALDTVGACPVRVIPLPVLPPTAPTALTRSMLGLPEDKIVFLFPYDFLSVLRRKNPHDVIAAYTSAFGPDDGTVLVLKSINGHQSRSDLDQVRHWAGARPDILVRDGYLDAVRMRALIELSDCLVSLHRAEGYGINLVDAMALGKPVIATGYSGNLAFMDDESAFLVPCEDVEVGDDAWPYDPGARWAQPDVDAAAGLLRLIVDEPERAATVARNGQRRTLAELDVAVVATTLRPLLVESLLMDSLVVG